MTCLLVLLPACRRFTKEFADDQVYSILDKKRRACVPELAGTLNIEAQAELEEAARARKAYVLDADAAVGLAMISSREFRTQREQVYLTALDLTLAWREFDPIWDAGGNAGLDIDSTGISTTSGFGAAVSKALTTGGSIIFALATDFLRGLTSNPAEIAQSIITADMVLPLLRGSGRLVAMENVRQSERDTLYALREFARFQQELRVDIASAIYAAIELEQRWTNEEAAYESLQQLVLEQTDSAAAGKIPEFQLDQARTDLFEADDRRQRAQRAFEDAIDVLKFDLGIPMQIGIVLVREDVMRILEDGPGPPPYSLDDAIEIAGERRLDLKNARDREIDAERHVLVARNALLTQLDIVGGGSLDTPGRRAFDFEDVEARGDIGLILDLPLERTAERNAYVRTIISLFRAKRARERIEDNVDRQVRTAYRRLEQTRRSYSIQLEGERLAERRVESTGLLLQRGSANIRDRLESESARRDARNALTGAIIEYAIAYLAYERDIGTLVVHEPPETLPPGPDPVVPEPTPPEADVDDG